jgi:hypothetical protein
MKYTVSSERSVTLPWTKDTFVCERNGRIFSIFPEKRSSMMTTAWILPDEFLNNR